MIKYGDKNEIFSDSTGDTSSNSPYSSYSEAFPWLCDEEGKPLDTGKPIDLLKGVVYVTRYLELRYGVDMGKVSEYGIRDLLHPFFEGKVVSTFSLFKHVSDLHKNNRFTDLVTSTSTVKSETDQVETGEGAAIAEGVLAPGSKIPQYLGSYGEHTLNETIHQALEAKWDFFYNSAKLSVNLVPTAANIVGYGLIVKTFVKHIHNRPYSAETLADKTGKKLKRALFYRNQQLLAFTVLGAPLVLLLTKNSSIGLKNMLTLELFPLSNETKDTVKGFSLLALFTSINKWIP